MSVDNHGAIKAIKTNPSYLATFSATHTWPFSAIAELIDNAYDEIDATKICIDVETINDQKCLVFTDDGNGMTADNLYKMCSLGFSQKDTRHHHDPIGCYGSGFKTGSMRLGKDAMVFTRRDDTTSVALLSQTYLKAIEAETVRLPIVSWSVPNFEFASISTTNSDQQLNLAHITQYSLFPSKDQLIDQITGMTHSTGTKVIIYNLEKNSQGLYELDFDSDDVDIRCVETLPHDTDTSRRAVTEVTPAHHTSLRAYCRILYLTPRKKIFLRGKKVITTLSAKHLNKREKRPYKPSWLEKAVDITIGISKSPNKADYGAMMYNKNRLIKGYKKIGHQKNVATVLDVHVVAVAEVPFTPIHNKQDFHSDHKYGLFLRWLAEKMKQYYDFHTDPSFSPTLENNDTEDDRHDLKISAGSLGVQPKHFHTACQSVSDGYWSPKWKQCDKCGKWRHLLDFIDLATLPDDWFCRMNDDASYNRCDIPEGAVNDDSPRTTNTPSKAYHKNKAVQKKKRRAEQLKRTEGLSEELREQKREVIRLQAQQEDEVNLLKRQNEELVATLAQTVVGQSARMLKKKRVNEVVATLTDNPSTSNNPVASTSKQRPTTTRSGTKKSNQTDVCTVNQSIASEIKQPIASGSHRPIVSGRRQRTAHGRDQAITTGGNVQPTGDSEEGCINQSMSQTPSQPQQNDHAPTLGTFFGRNNLKQPKGAKGSTKKSPIKPNFMPMHNALHSPNKAHMIVGHSSDANTPPITPTKPAPKKSPNNANGSTRNNEVSIPVDSDDESLPESAYAFDTQSEGSIHRNYESLETQDPEAVEGVASVGNSPQVDVGIVFETPHDEASLEDRSHTEDGEIDLKQRVADLTAQLELNEVAIAQKDTRIAEKVATINEQRLSITHKDAEIKEKCLAIAQKDTKIKEQRLSITHKDTEIKEKCLAIAQKDTEIKEQSLSITHKDAEIKEKCLAIAQKDTEIKEQRFAVAQKDTEIKEQRLSITHKDAEIKEKCLAIAQKDTEIKEQRLSITHKDAEIKEKCLAVAQKDTEIKEQRLSITHKDAEIKEKCLAIAQKDTEIEKQCLALAQKDTEIKEQRLSITHKDAEIKENCLAIAQKDTEIKEQRLAIAQKDTEIEKHCLAIAQKDTEINDQRLAVAQKDTEIEKHCLAVAQKDAEIKEQRLAVAQKDTEIEKHCLALHQKDTTIKVHESSLVEKGEIIRQRDLTLAQKDRKIEGKDKKIEEKDKKIEEKDKKIEEKDKKIEEKDKMIKARNLTIETVKKERHESDATLEDLRRDVIELLRQEDLLEGGEIDNIEGVDTLVKEIVSVCNSQSQSQ